MPPIRFEVESAALASSMPYTRKLVLLALATLADNNTGVVPERRKKSLTELAALTSLGRSTVARDLDLLEYGKWISRDRPSMEDARKGMMTGYRLTLPPGVVHEVDQLVQEVDQGSPRDGRKRDPSDPTTDPSDQKMASRRGRAQNRATVRRRNLPTIIREVRLGLGEVYSVTEEQELSDEEVLGFWATYLRADDIRDMAAYVAKIAADAPYLDTLMQNVAPVCCGCIQYYENCKCAA